MMRALGTIALMVALLSTADAAFPPNISFAGAPVFSVGEGPSSVSGGDFNADGIPDLAVISGNHNAAGVYLGNGDGTFRRGPNSPRATDARLTVSGTVGDFNGDGKLDVLATAIPDGLFNDLWGSITGDIGGDVSVFLGDGAGNIGSHIDTGVGANFPTGAAAGDFNGDGKLDVAVANLGSHNVSILLGQNNGKFDQASGSPLHVGSRPTAVAVGDLNGDGKADVVVTNGLASTLSTLLGRGDGTFNAQATVSVLSRPVSVAIGEFNGDSKADVAVAGQLSSNVSILLGNGSGSYTSITRFPAGRYPSGVFLGDFNNDSKQDLAVVNRLSDMVSLLLGNGNGTFARARNFSVGGNNPLAVTGGDFNRDGRRDLAFANVASDTVSVLVNDTDLTPPDLTMPTLVATYEYNASLTLTFDATDAGSGISSIVATLNGVAVTNGQTVVLTHAGTNTFTLTATDKVGNVATQTATFTVLYNFGGFLPPMPPATAGVFKLGSIIALRFQLTDANDAAVSTAVAKLTVQKVAGGTVVGTAYEATAPGSADTGNLFDYYTGANQYAYNLDTSPFSKGTWQIQVSLDDGSVHAVVIGLK